MGLEGRDCIVARGRGMHGGLRAVSQGHSGQGAEPHMGSHCDGGQAGLRLRREGDDSPGKEEL